MSAPFYAACLAAAAFRAYPRCIEHFELGTAIKYDSRSFLKQSGI
jgi:hypothetical protein